MPRWSFPAQRGCRRAAAPGPAACAAAALRCSVAAAATNRRRRRDRRWGRGSVRPSLSWEGRHVGRWTYCSRHSTSPNLRCHCIIPSSIFLTRAPSVPLNSQVVRQMEILLVDRPPGLGLVRTMIQCRFEGQIAASHLPGVCAPLPWADVRDAAECVRKPVFWNFNAKDIAFSAVRPSPVSLFPAGRSPLTLAPPPASSSPVRLSLPLRRRLRPLCGLVGTAVGGLATSLAFPL